MIQPRLLLIDGTGLLVRSSRAGRRTGMNDGRQSTATLHLWIRSVARLLRTYAPSHVLVCFDGYGSRYPRRRRYPLYKANRADPPTVTSPDMQLVLDFCRAARLPWLAWASAEADDQIAWAIRVTSQWAEPPEVIIAADDHDMHQLVGPGVSQVLMSGYSGRRWDEEQVTEFYGVAPRQLPDYWALAGDRSDNIPGVLGYGPVRARRIFANGQGSLSEVLDSMPPAVAMQAVMFADLMNLRTAGMELEARIGADPGELCSGLRWHSGMPADLIRFLEDHAMAQTITLLKEGLLW